ncbi:hypothetical protein T261_8324 [Streptomyces lydicus]|nr:hypothetical protein T261_8324 [Streptomyces lydicus]
MQGSLMACLWVGPDPAANELLTIQSSAADSEAVRTAKRLMIQVMANALVTGRAVEATHPDDSSEVVSVDLSAGNTSTHPLQMDALEVTQGVQDLGHSVPLVADKRTVVRAYLSYYGSAPVSVTGQLSVRRPSAAPVVVPSANTVTLNPADAGNLTRARDDANRSLNFVLPAAATAAGQLTVWLSGVTDSVTGNPIALGGERRPTVTFQPSPPLRVRIVRFTYQQGTPPVTHAPRNIDFDLLVSWLGRAYPVAQVLNSQAVVAATATVPFAASNINAQLAAIRTQDVSAGTDARTHYYGMVSDTGFFMRGSAASVPDTSPDPTVVACGPTGVPSGIIDFSWDADGSYGDWYGGHELGHTLGRLHPGFCGETADDLNNYPFPVGQLSHTDAGFAGFDVGDPANTLPMTAMPGTQWHDVMTYCPREWLSVYTYEGIRRRLVAENALPSFADGGGGPAPGQTVVNVVSTVNLTQGQGKIAFVNPAPNVSPTAPVPDSPVTLRFTTADGAVVEEHSAPVKLDSELTPDEDRVGIVDATVTAGPEVTVVELVVGGAVVDTFRAGAAPPVTRAMRTELVDRQRLRVAADLERPAEEGHTFTVQISSDQGRTWQTVGVGLKTPSVTLDRSQLDSGRELLVRVIATNGFTAVVGPSESFGV